MPALLGEKPPSTPTVVVPAGHDQGVIEEARRRQRRRRIGIALSGLLYPMGIAALGVVVSLAGLKSRTDEVKIWEEVGGAPPLVPDQP